MRVRRAKVEPALRKLCGGGVAEAAGKLQDAGLIQYRRGKITVVDRPGLEARVCECCQVVKTEFDRLLPNDAKSPSQRYR